MTDAGWLTELLFVALQSLQLLIHIAVAVLLVICRVNQQVQNHNTCLKNSHFGVEKFNFSLGLSFNFFCMSIILLSVNRSKESFLGMCVVSLSSHKTFGHVEFHENGLSDYWRYSFEEHCWKKCEGVSLRDEDVEVLRLSAAGLTMTEIADRMCCSLDSIKSYKRHTFDRLGVTNIMQAISRAALNKMF
ncbi:MAG: helix-turn-helix transcriptional regulator [Prevotella sp.]|nr:helix-turn-helix transcriptional regulator [Prevotella sp.]